MYIGKPGFFYTECSLGIKTCWTYNRMLKILPCSDTFCPTDIRRSWVSFSAFSTKPELSPVFALFLLVSFCPLVHTSAVEFHLICTVFALELSKVMLEGSCPDLWLLIYSRVFIHDLMMCLDAVFDPHVATHQQQCFFSSGKTPHLESTLDLVCQIKSANFPGLVS